MTTVCHDAYRLAAFLGVRFGADRLVDIRLGSTGGRDVLETLRTISFDVEPDAKERRAFLSTERVIELDLRRENWADLPPSVARRSVVVCSNVLEGLSDPATLLRRLSWVSRSALAVVITTPERDHVERRRSSGLAGDPIGQWDLSEFKDLLHRCQITPSFVGLIADSDERPDKNTIVAILDQCPIGAGQAVPDDFRPLALMVTFNEIDIAPQTVTALLDDGFDVCVQDNWSSDGTFERLRDMAHSRSGLSLSRFPEAPVACFDYLGVLQWKEEIAARHPGRWIASVDSDEIRASPWPDVSFRGGLYICEIMGYTAVDLTVLHFAAVDNEFSTGDDPETSLPYFEFGRFGADFCMLKTWRQGSQQVDLRTGAGHEAKFEGRVIFPYKFILKHYPLRNSEQARRKVFTERKPRYSPITRAMGWHIQYDEYQPDDSFLRLRSDLIEFDKDRTRREYLVELISGVGIIRSGDDDHEAEPEAADAPTDRSPAEPTLPTAIGHLDEVRLEGVFCKLSGWAIDASGTPMPLHAIQFENHSVTTFRTARVPRPDVVAAYPHAHRDSGFELTFSLLGLPEEAIDSSRLVVVGRDAADDVALPAGPAAVWPVAGVRQAIASAPQIPDAPSMPDPAVRRLSALLEQANCYLEYGTGGSTMLARRLRVPHVIGVESDESWLEALRHKARTMGGDEVLELIHIDVGSTGEWGYPTSESGWRNYVNYPLAPWAPTRLRHKHPDVILIDGRFRVACFLASLLHGRPGVRILFDDYFSRPHYGVVERFVQPQQQHDRAAEFVVPREVPDRELWHALLASIPDAR